MCHISGARRGRALDGLWADDFDTPHLTTETGYVSKPVAVPPIVSNQAQAVLKWLSMARGDLS